MKKLKAILMIFCILVCLNACKKSKDKIENNVKENKTVQSETKKEEKKKDNDKKVSDSKKDENKDGKKEEKSDNKKLIKKTGLFLGLDGSNFAVVIVNDENGTTQLNLQLSKEADMDNSDVEIGDTVNIEYTADETDNKILKKISKVK